MSIKLKMIEDINPKSSFILIEAVGLIDELSTVLNYLAPYSTVDTKQYRSVVAWVLAGRQPIANAKIKSLTVNYPNIASLVENCKSEPMAVNRLHSAIYKLSSINSKLQKAAYTIKTDDARFALSEEIKSCISDIAVFIIGHFKLYKIESTGEVTRSVWEYCDSNNITASVLFGHFYALLKNMGGDIYGYEVCSDHYYDMQESYAALVNDAEEIRYPLSNEICYRLLSGEIREEDVRNDMAAFTKQANSQEVDCVNPANMIQYLNLE